MCKVALLSAYQAAQGHAPAHTSVGVSSVATLRWMLPVLALALRTAEHRALVALIADLDQTVTVSAVELPNDDVPALDGLPVRNLPVAPAEAIRTLVALPATVFFTRVLGQEHQATFGIRALSKSAAHRYSSFVLKSTPDSWSSDSSPSTSNSSEER